MDKFSGYYCFGRGLQSAASKLIKAQIKAFQLSSLCKFRFDNKVHEFGHKTMPVGLTVQAPLNIFF
jgi:hypothetical protein